MDSGIGALALNFFALFPFAVAVAQSPHGMRTAAVPAPVPALERAVDIDVFRLVDDRGALRADFSIVNLSRHPVGDIHAVLDLCSFRDLDHPVSDIAGLHCVFRHHFAPDFTLAEGQRLESSLAVPHVPANLMGVRLGVLSVGNGESGGSSKPMIADIPESILRVRSGAESPIEIVSSSIGPAGSADAQPLTTQYNLAIAPSEGIESLVGLKNRSDDAFAIFAEVRVYRGNVLSTQVLQERSELFVIAAREERAIHIPIPKVDAPQRYLATIQFSLANGQPCSEILTMRFLVRGKPASNITSTASAVQIDEPRELPTEPALFPLEVTALPTANISPQLHAKRVRDKAHMFATVTVLLSVAAVWGLFLVDPKRVGRYGRR